MVQLSNGTREALIVGLALGKPHGELARGLGFSRYLVAVYARRHRKSIQQLQSAVKQQGNGITGIETIRAEVRDYRLIMTEVEIHDHLKAARSV